MHAYNLHVDTPLCFKGMFHLTILLAFVVFMQLWFTKKI